MGSSLRRWRSLLCLIAALLAGTACGGFEEKRIRELLHDKGFGARAQGVAVQENYLTGGDAVQFLMDPSIYLTAGAEQLSLLLAPQYVSIDGTILIPYVGSVYVLGMTEAELASLVSTQLQPFFNNFQITLQARILNLGKAFFAFGEFARKGRMPMANGDQTVLDVVATVGVTGLANLGRIKLVRPDAENPLVVTINLREFIETGNTKYNLRVQDNDILYVPPTFFGAIARFVGKLVEPIGVVVGALFSAANIRQSYDILMSDDPIYGYYRF
jgi:protein involved in polysaccharide export with SLBB domain